MVFYDKVMHCDCCKKRVDHVWEVKKRNYRYQWAYLFSVYTTEGRKWLCGHCLYCYNILDRFPTKKERNLDSSELNAIRIKEKGI